MSTRKSRSPGPPDTTATPPALPARHARSALAVLALAGWALVAPARAELWGYVDGNGQAHFASEPLDSRYQLFFKGRSSLDPVPAPPPAPTAAELLGDDSLWKRVEGHPNVARFEPLVTRNARENGLEPALVKAVIAVESGYDPAAVSGKGAVGLMQVLPDTGERYGMVGDAKRSIAQKLAEPAINVRVGTRYLKELIARYAGDLELALAAYNAGEGIVDRYGGVPPYPETQAFVRLVLRFREAWLPAPPPAPAPARPSRVTIAKPGAKP